MIYIALWILIKNIWAYDGKKHYKLIPHKNIHVVERTGAGDAFMGGLSYGILKNMKLKEIGMFANACGAYCCTKIGTRSSGKLDEIKDFIK